MQRVCIRLAACLLACSPAAAKQRVDVPALGCSLDVPAGSAVEQTDDGATITTKPGTRAPRTIGLHARAPADVTGTRQRLADDITITFTLQTHDGGSGGDEASLIGALQVGDRGFAVECHDQAEAPAKPDARWCLPWLASVRHGG